MSPFDWHKETLGPNTIITSSYKNTQNVRRFFKSKIGENFSFTRDFMKWMKENRGKNLGDAIAQWKKRNKF